jgi:UDP-N-acetylglucosamine kinase
LPLGSAEQQIADSAVAYAKKHRSEISRRLTDPAVYPPEAHPVSVFMAGSPGAGKTEASIELLESLAESGLKVLRIDPDELRQLLPGYTGANAWMFQRAVTPIVEAIHDRALKQGQSFILDGTLSSYDVARKNMARSLKRGRPVQVLYVYQEPAQAWKFVQAREMTEGRRIEPADFARQYFAARDVVNRLKTEWGKQIQVDLLLKNIDGSNRVYWAGVDKIDNYIPEKYSLDEVHRLIGLL